ncbi:MAG: nuclear transport factor 2 family protein [Saprospiraceae bacterium]|nr:nuclear transport factor 2 family protein [Saprospiraceae bacterium]
MKQSKIFFMLLALVCSAAFIQAQSANVKTAMDGYAKFGAGDIPGILASLSPDIVWIHAGDPAIVPFAGTFKGQVEVGRFFESVGNSIEVSVFAPSNFREEGNKVINDVHIEGVARSTGKKYSDDLVMTWTFDTQGKAVRWEATGTMTGITSALMK